MTTPVEATRAPYPSTAGAELIARLERAPFSRWHLRARIVMGSATFFDAFDALSLAFVLPVLVRLWDISAWREPDQSVENIDLEVVEAEGAIEEEFNLKAVGIGHEKLGHV